MDAWIISDHDDLADRIRRALDRPEMGCSYLRGASVAGCLHSGVSTAANEDIIFYATSNINTNDLEVLRQLRAAFRGGLAVVAPLTDNSEVLRVIRAGAEDFLDVDGDLDAEIATFLAKVHAEKAQDTAKGQLVCVLSGDVSRDAGVLAANLAAVIADKTGNCALLDFQSRGGDLALLLKIVPRHTLHDLVRQQQGIDHAMFQQALTRHESGVRLLAGNRSCVDTKVAPPESCQEIVKMAQATHPCVVVASDDVRQLVELVTLSSSDRVVLVMRLDMLSLNHAQQHVDYLRRNNVSLDRLEVVAMGTGKPGELPSSAVAKSLGLLRINQIPEDGMASIVAINLGNPLVIESPNSRASVAIKRFASILCTPLGQLATPTTSQRLTIAKAAALGAITALVSRR